MVHVHQDSRLEKVPLARRPFSPGQKLRTSLHRLVMELSGVAQPSNRPVTGTRLFDVESGIIASWVRNVRDVDLVEALPYAPELVGQTGPRLVLGKGSGLDSVAEWLDAAGLSATDEQAMAILQRVKEASLDKRGLLELKEFRDIALAVIGDPAPIA